MGINKKTERARELAKQGNRRCAKCKKVFSLDKFGPTSVRGDKRSYCRLCDKNRQREWRAKNKDHVNAYHRDYNCKYKVKRSIQTKCRVYGMTKQEYLELFRQQNGKCVICGVSHLECVRGLHVDHNHETGEVRGLLCQQCNWMLGNCKENPEILNKAIRYLNIKTVKTVF